MDSILRKNHNRLDLDCAIPDTSRLGAKVCTRAIGESRTSARGIFFNARYRYNMNEPFRWGHINIIVTNLDLSIRFYERLGFELFMPGIPYLGLEAGKTSAAPGDAAAALALAHGTQGRACMKQLGRSFPKLDLTELSAAEKRRPLQNQDRGIVRLCLASEDLRADYLHLLSQKAEFLSPPR